MTDEVKETPMSNLRGAAEGRSEEEEVTAAEDEKESVTSMHAAVRQENVGAAKGRSETEVTAATDAKEPVVTSKLVAVREENGGTVTEDCVDDKSGDDKRDMDDDWDDCVKAYKDRYDGDLLAAAQDIGIRCSEFWFGRDGRAFDRRRQKAAADIAKETDSAASKPDADVQQKDHRPLLRAYQPLDMDAIRVEMGAFHQTQQEMDAEWEEECAKYEKMMVVEIDGEKKTVPQRNYLNASGMVRDTTLFPYHDACYPLLDAYDCLYDDQNDQPIEKNEMRPFATDRRRDILIGFNNVHGYMPASMRSIIECLVQVQSGWSSPEYEIDAEEFYHHCHHVAFHNFSFLHDRLAETREVNEKGDDPNFWRRMALQMMKGASLKTYSYGAPSLPSSREERAPILLRLLRHSLSELQRDHRLALAVLICLAQHHDLDDISILRRMLAVLDLEYVLCSWPCFNEDEEELELDHCCNDLAKFCDKSMLPSLICHGITLMTELHATTLVAFVRVTYMREFGHLHVDTEEVDVEEKRKALLKRAVVALRSDEVEDEVERTSENRVPVWLVGSVVTALGIRAAAERRRLLSSLDDTSVSEDIISQCLDSFQNSVRALVDIAEASLLCIPANERFSCITSQLVRSLADAFVDLKDHYPQTGTEFPRARYVGRDIKDWQLIAPLRYFNCIANATEIARSQKRAAAPNASSRDRLVVAVQNSCAGRLPSDVLDVVRGLYVLDLVDIRQAGMGYGDFLVWCGGRGEINPLDAPLFWADCAFPYEDSDDDDDDDEEEEDEEEDSRGQLVDWEDDEEGHTLRKFELEARHDATLLALLQAWNSAWSPENHMSFQPQFRDAAKTIALCTQRLEIPVEINRRVNQFMHRDWWPDKRKQCWNYDCQVEQVTKLMKRKAAARDKKVLPPIKSVPVEVCPRCRVTSYCSAECKNGHFKDCHKKNCCRPPYRIPGKEEAQLLVQVLGNDAPRAIRRDAVEVLQSSSAEPIDETPLAQYDEGSGVDSDDETKDDDDDDDDDGSWESIDSDDDSSDEDSRSASTRLIHSFFSKHSYRLQH